jgi:uncharacterized protein YjeT (DUF2065 family)
MTSLRWIGAAVLVLGILTLFVPIPQRERHGITVGDVSLGVVTQSDQKAPVALSAVMILGGLGAMALGGRRGS